MQHYGGFQHFDGKPKPSGRSLFVGDLSFFCSESELIAAFSKFGDIRNVEIKRSRAGESLMHGFVDFLREDDAYRAIEGMNGRKFMGRILKVNWTNQRLKDNSDIQRNDWIQVHVNFLSPYIDRVINEEFLEPVFARFGNLADLSVKRHLLSYRPRQVTGYAFVYFANPDSALHAIYALKEQPVNGVFFECCLSYKAELMLKDFRGMAPVIKNQQISNPSAFFKRFESHNPEAKQLKCFDLASSPVCLSDNGLNHSSNDVSSQFNCDSSASFRDPFRIPSMSAREIHGKSLSRPENISYVNKNNENGSLLANSAGAFPYLGAFESLDGSRTRSISFESSSIHLFDSTSGDSQISHNADGIEDLLSRLPTSRIFESPSHLYYIDPQTV